VEEARQEQIAHHERKAVKIRAALARDAAMLKNEKDEQGEERGMEEVEGPEEAGGEGWVAVDDGEGRKSEP
jgi:hypothetical protein